LRDLYVNSGEPIATRKFVRAVSNGFRNRISMEKEDLVYLPSHYSYQTLLDKLKNENPKVKLSLESFKEFWINQADYAQLKIRNPFKDFCDECKIFAFKIFIFK
jgi:hypothetical protein